MPLNLVCGLWGIFVCGCATSLRRNLIVGFLGFSSLMLYLIGYKVVVILKCYTRTGLLFAFEVGDVFEHSINISVYLISLAQAPCSTNYQTDYAANDYTN